MLWTLIFTTTLGVSTVPGMTEMECAWAVNSAPLVVAQQSRTSGRPIQLIEARCQKET